MFSTLTALKPLTLTTVFEFRTPGAESIAALAKFRGGLSPDSLYNRYFVPTRLGDAALREWARTLVDTPGAQQLSWVAVDRAQQVIALLELAREPSHPADAEMGVVVADAYQRQGIGSALGRHALPLARLAGIRRVSACMLSENRAAQRFVRRLGVPLTWQDDAELRFATLAL